MEIHTSLSIFQNNLSQPIDIFVTINTIGSSRHRWLTSSLGFGHSSETYFERVDKVN